MTFLHERILDLDDAYQREDIAYTFTNGLPTGLTSSVTGSGAVTTVGYDDARGSALKLTHGANPATTDVGGPPLGRSVVKAMLADVGGISFGGTNDPLFAVGFYQGGFAHYAELFRDATTAGIIVSQNTSSVNRTIRKVGITADKDGEYDAGLLVDYAGSQVIGHVGHAYGHVTNAAHIPGADLQFVIRGITDATHHTFDVYIRRLTLTVWRDKV